MDKEKSIQFSRIFKVAFGSFAIAVALIIIISGLSFPLGIEKETTDFLFGDWALLFRIVIAMMAFPILWRYMK